MRTSNSVTFEEVRVGQLQWADGTCTQEVQNTYDIQSLRVPRTLETESRIAGTSVIRFTRSGTLQSTRDSRNLYSSPAEI